MLTAAIMMAGLAGGIPNAPPAEGFGLSTPVQTSPQPGPQPAPRPGPPVFPPPGSPQAPPGGAPRPPGVTTLEDLVRQGFEVKAMQAAGSGDGRFVVLLQRSGEVRTCLLRIDVPRGTSPVRRSVCF